MSEPTIVDYVGDGSTTDFNFSFDYIDSDHVTVLKDGVATAFTLIAQGTVRLSPAPGVGVDISIRRVTPGDPLVVWPPGAVIRGDDLNTAATQPRYIAEEARDITSALEATVTDAVDDAAASAVAAAASAVAADNSADAALASENAAAASASAASTSYDNFDDRYLGAKAVAPTLDNDGNALLTGALYFNTVTNKMYTWTGAAWTLAFSDIAIASLITNDSGVSGANVAAALDTLNSGKQAAAANLTSWAALAPAAKADASHVHSAADITSGTLATARMPVGSILQVVESKFTSRVTTTASIPVDDTIPQNTEGAEAFTLSFTPKEATSKILVEVMGWCDQNVTTYAMFALFKDSDASAFASLGLNPTAGSGKDFSFRGSFTAGGTSSITIKLRFGITVASGATLAINGFSGGGTYFSTTDGTSIKITEIKV